ncbi:MAG: hypothetical protein BYD32DRAFT_428995 [Podila humilis]|nr:MAG: hypothetical protein BYD32DRAFT_428995 [Podila humilis]
MDMNMHLRSVFVAFPFLFFECVNTRTSFSFLTHSSLLSATKEKKMNEKTSLMDEKSTPPSSAPQSDVVPPTSSLQTPRNESSFSSILLCLMPLILVALSKLYFIIGLAALTFWYIFGMEATKAFSVAQSIYFFDAPIRLLFSLYRSRNSKKEQEAQGDDCWSSNDCFTQDTIGGCATLILSSCVTMAMIDEDWFLNRTFCGVVILGSLVTLGATVSRYRLKKKKNCNPYLRRIDIFNSSPFFASYIIASMYLMGSMARYHSALTAANGPSTL